MGERHTTQPQKEAVWDLSYPQGRVEGLAGCFWHLPLYSCYVFSCGISINKHMLPLPSISILHLSLSLVCVCVLSGGSRAKSTTSASGLLTCCTAPHS